MGVNSLDSVDTVAAIRQICGRKLLTMVYSDRHDSIKVASRELSFLWRKPPAGDHQANGVIEALNRRVQDGARALLTQAGLPVCWWNYAVEHWCFLRNIATDAAGMSPYERTRGFKFGGLKLPFGVGVFYYPNDTKYKHQQDSMM